MADYPAMPLWTDAYLADTTHLSDAEHGRYMLMLMHLWRVPGQRFPNDDEWLARKFGRTVEQVREQLRPLIAEFFQSDGNWLRHKRVDREFAHVSSASRKQSDRAKSRWAKEKDQSRGNAASGIAPTPPSESYSRDSESLPPLSASAESPPASAGAAPPRRARGAGRPGEWTRMPDDWQAAEGDLAYAEQQGFSRAEALGIAANFRAHWVNQRGARATKRDWGETWRAWVRRDADRRPARSTQRAGPPARLTLDDQTDMALAYLNRRKASADAPDEPGNDHCGGAQGTALVHPPPKYLV